MPTRFQSAPRVFPLPGGPQVPELLVALAHKPGLVALDGAGGTPCDFSIVGFDPVATIERGSGFALSELRAFLARLEPTAGDPVPGPFHGGFLGAVAYDVGVAGERPVPVAPEPWGLPLASGGLYVDYCVRDERTHRTWLVLGDEPGDDRPSVSARRAAVAADLARTAGAAAAPLRPLGPLVRHVPPAEHRRRVADLRARIARGDLYQANVAHRFTRRIAGAPLDLYRALRSVNPAPYMFWLRPDPTSSWALCSASPELLLDLEEGTASDRPASSHRTARTRPIKGTIARPADPAADPAADRERARQLLASDKDRAELAMIVDLERNDLGRIARPGSVRVEGFPSVQSYPALHHLVADVVAEPLDSVDAVDVLAAIFPGGSITGAPKLAAMEAIAELECEGRGFFTGSAGFLDVRGRAIFNILIRTVLWRADPARPGQGEVSFRAGGGITWNSDPAAEDEETLVKASRLAAAVEGRVSENAR